jgi:hypothetical protein
LIGFCDSFLDCIYEYEPSFQGIVGNRIHDIRIVGAVTLCFILGLVIVGMDWVTRVTERQCITFQLLHSRGFRYKWVSWCFSSSPS